MTGLELIKARHSVRSYLNKPIESEKTDRIEAEIARLNALSGLNIQFMKDASGVFDRLLSKFIGWKYVPCYLALVGPESADLEERCGYFGEKLVIFLQSLGLNTCWVGMFRPEAVKAEVKPGEKLVITIAVGYGENSGRPHKSKDIEDITDIKNMPDWFRAGLECVLLAPTAINQQKFFFTLDGETPIARISGKGPFIDVDLGIAKYHFEIGSGRKI